MPADEPDPRKPATWPRGWRPQWGYAAPASWTLSVYLFQLLHNLPADGLFGPQVERAGYKLWGPGQ